MWILCVGPDRLVSTLACSGFLYKGICLRAVKTSSSSDQIPSGCNAYQPSLSWTRTDFTAICRNFGGANCDQVDTDVDGGRCSNYRAVLAYETNTGPDVWVASATFTWNPVSSGSPNCALIAHGSGAIVYACK